MYLELRATLHFNNCDCFVMHCLHMQRRILNIPRSNFSKSDYYVLYLICLFLQSLLTTIDLIQIWPTGWLYPHIHTLMCFESFELNSDSNNNLLWKCIVRLLHIKYYNVLLITSRRALFVTIVVFVFLCPEKRKYNRLYRWVRKAVMTGPTLLFNKHTATELSTRQRIWQSNVLFTHSHSLPSIQSTQRCSAMNNCLTLSPVFSGTVFAGKKLEGDKRNAVKKFAAVFAKRVAKTAVPNPCQTCECNAHDNGMSFMECFPCQYPTTAYPDYVSHSAQSNWLETRKISPRVASRFLEFRRRIVIHSQADRTRRQCT